MTLYIINNVCILYIMITLCITDLHALVDYIMHISVYQEHELSLYKKHTTLVCT